MLTRGATIYAGWRQTRLNRLPSKAGAPGKRTALQAGQDALYFANGLLRRAEQQSRCSPRHVADRNVCEKYRKPLAGALSLDDGQD